MVKEAPRTPEQVLLGTPVMVPEDDLDTIEPVDEPPKRKIIQLSSVSLTKNHLQKKADGTTVLRFPDSSEVLAPCSPSDTLPFAD